MSHKFDTPYIDGGSAATAPPCTVHDNISLIIDPYNFSIMSAGYSQVYINLTFDVNPQSSFLNNTLSSPFDYNYDSANVTQPHLKDAVVEVAAW
jgi:hypothetical protein